MTIRLLTARGIYPANAIVTLDVGTEAGLVVAKQASRDLAGGLPYVPPAAQNQIVTANLVVSPSGDVLGLAGPGGSVLPLGGGVASIPFGSVVPLSGSVVMARQAVTGPITFSPVGAVSGGSCVAELVANGVNIPDCSAFEEHSSSSGWVNTAGYTNLLQFFTIGARCYFSASQPVKQVVTDLTAPTVVSAVVANATPAKLTTLFSEALAAGFVPAASSFAVSGHAVTAVEISGSTATLTVSAFVGGEAASVLSYTQPASNGLRDAAGNLVASFSGRAITNNVAVVTPATAIAVTGPSAGTTGAASGAFIVSLAPAGGTVASATTFTPSAADCTFTPASVSLTTGASATFTVTAATDGAKTISFANNGGLANPANMTYTASAAAAASIVRFASLVNTVESGSADPYTYTGNNISFGAAMGGVATKARQVGIDGSCAGIVVFGADANHELMLALDDSATPVAYTALNHAIFAPSTGTYRVINAGASTAATVAVAIAAGDYIRLRVAGTDLFAEVSKDSGATWTIIYTWSAISAASIRYHVQVAKVGALMADKIVGAA